MFKLYLSLLEYDKDSNSARVVVSVVDSEKVRCGKQRAFFGCVIKMDETGYATIKHGITVFKKKERLCRRIAICTMPRGQSKMSFIPSGRISRKR